MSNKVNTELSPIIRDIEAITRCLESTIGVLRTIAARPWPDIPDGEGIAGEPGTCAIFTGFKPTATDPRD